MENKILTKNKTSTERGREFKERMRDKGYVWLCLWVPEKYKERVKNFVRKFNK